MKVLKKSRTNGVWLYRNTLLAIVSLLLVIRSEAQTYTTLSPNGQQSFVTTVNGANSGLYDWQLSPTGPSQLAQQWFYYSLGSGPVYSIDQISATPTITIRGGASPSITAVYSNAQISVSAVFKVSNLGILSDTLTVQNPASSGLDQMYHFYQYSDFDLGGVNTGQTVQFSNNGQGVNYQVNQNGSAGFSLQGVLISASATTQEVEAGVGTQFGLANGNTVSPLDNTLSAGPGDAVYAYEWDKDLASGTGSIQISEQQTITAVPEPSCFALMAFGMLALGVCYRHLQAKSAIFVPIKVK